MTPTHTTYTLGATLYDAPLSITLTRGSEGARQWVLTKEAANYRDDTQRITGITDDQIKAMWDALCDNKQRR